MSDFELGRRGFMAGAGGVGLASLLGTTGLVHAQENRFQLTDPVSETLTGDGAFKWIDSGDNKARFYQAFFQEYDQARGLEASVYQGLPWSEIATVVPLGIRNGTAPDVFSLPLSVSGAYAVSQGWVQPYDDYIPDIETWKAGFPAGAFLEGLNVFDGKTYGLPYNSGRVNSALTLYNRPLLEDAGYDPENQPLTWDSMRDAALKVTQNSGGSKFGWIIGGAQVNRWANVVRSIAQVAGASGGSSSLWADFDMRSGDFLFDSDEYVGAIELLLAMKQDGSVFPGVMSMNAPQARAFMAQGVAGMILQGPWCVPQWEQEAPDFDFGSAPPPYRDANDRWPLIADAVASPANTMWIYSGSKNVQIAADIFRYLGTEQGQTDWAGIVGPGDPPVVPAAVGKATLTPPSRSVLELSNSVIRVGPSPLVRTPALVEAISAFTAPTPALATAVQGLFSGQLDDVKGTMTKLKSDMNLALDAALSSANEKGANVSRSDLIFANWDPKRDFTGADYDAS